MSKEEYITDSKQIQKMFLAVMPMWHYKLTKPFKHLLLDNVSLDIVLLYTDYQSDGQGNDNVRACAGNAYAEAKNDQDS